MADPIQLNNKKGPDNGEFSNYLEAKLDELVTANRILGRENVYDAFGHVSIKHPDRDDRYFLSSLVRLSGLRLTTSWNSHLTEIR